MSLSSAKPVNAAMIAFALAGAVLVPFNIPLILKAQEQDSFFTLTALGGAGLALLSLVFLGLTFLLLGLKTGWLLAWRGEAAGLSIQCVALDIASGWLIYLLLHHLSPQLYYLYYMTLFDGLEMQRVIDTEVDWHRLSETVLPGPKERLAAFLACTGFWAVVPFTLLLHRRMQNED